MKEDFCQRLPWEGEGPEKGGIQPLPSPGNPPGQFHELFEGLKNLIESSFFSTKK
jgi:hypothetical protein